MSAPIVGIDGSLGYPAYSGSVSNPMLASALITVRESSLAGNATHGLYLPDYKPVQPPFLTEADVDMTSKKKVQGLQPNVRAALVEMELLRNIRFDQSYVSASVALVGGPTLATLGRLKDCVFHRQLQLVASFAALRAERSLEILTQVVPQTAHWSSIAGLSPERHRYTWELIGIGLRFAMMVTMQFKYELNVARPWVLSAAVQPMLLTPGYTAYPSGHATEAHFVAELIPLLVGDPTHPHSECEQHTGRKDGIAVQLNRLAFRIAENRVVAGLHYPVDSIAGQVLGVMLARYLVWLTGDTLPRFKQCTLDVGAIAFEHPKDIAGDSERPVFDSFVDEQEYVKKPEDALLSTVPPAPVLRDLWALARREWT